MKAGCLRERGRPAGYGLPAEQAWMSARWISIDATANALSSRIAIEPLLIAGRCSWRPFGRSRFDRRPRLDVGTRRSPRGTR